MHSAIDQRSYAGKCRSFSLAVLLAFSLLLFSNCSETSRAISKLGSNDSAIRSEAINALVKIGQPAVAPLLKALSDKNDLKSSGAATALGLIGDRAAVEPLINLLSSSSDSVAEEAIKSLGHLKDPKAISLLRDRLADNSLAGDAAMALAEIGDEESIEKIASILRPDSYLHPLPQAKEKVCLALGKYGEAAVKPVLEELGHATWEDFRSISDKDPQTALIELVIYAPKAEYFLKALAAIGIPATDVLIASLEHQDENERIKAAINLGFIRSSEAIDPLIKAIKKARFPREYIEYTSLSPQYFYVETHYMLALSSIGTPQALNALVRLLADNDVVIGRVSHAVLASIRPRSKTIEGLIASLLEENVAVRNRAGAMLQEMTGAKLEADQKKWNAWWLLNKKRIEKEDQNKEAKQE